MDRVGGVNGKTSACASAACRNCSVGYPVNVKWLCHPKIFLSIVFKSLGLSVYKYLCPFSVRLLKNFTRYFEVRNLGSSITKLS